MVQTHMDFHGQGLAERLYQAIIAIATVVAFVVGYQQQDFKLTFQIWLAGFVTAFVVTLPPWPCYRRHPVAYRTDVKPLPVELGGEGPTGPAAAAAAKKRR